MARSAVGVDDAAGFGRQRQGEEHRIGVGQRVVQRVGTDHPRRAVHGRSRVAAHDGDLGPHRREQIDAGTR